MNAIPYLTLCFMLSGHLLPFTLLTCMPVEQRKRLYSFTHIIIEGQLKNTLNYSCLFIAFVCFCQNLRRTCNLSRFWLQPTLYIWIWQQNMALLQIQWMTQIFLKRRLLSNHDSSRFLEIITVFNGHYSLQK